MPEYIKSIFESILQWIFPVNPDIAEIEAMSSADFSLHARRVLEELPQGIQSLFKYKDPFVRKALWAVKYDGNKTIARLFAQLLYEHMLEFLSEAELYDNFVDPIIIPIPLSKERRAERGWNQAEIIAKELIKSNPQFILRTDIIFKIKHTTPQTRLSREERLKNLKGCFAIPDGAHLGIKNKNIILLDDVVTTGSTIIECRRTLLAAGARQVVAFTIAH
ncbi:MAG: competence protein competence protein ComFC [Candidatus Paceibacter sp.]|jgi:ComF family protein|nr:competence protein competence protein ComFC [Candidatus Paceibacter sp.]